MNYFIFNISGFEGISIFRSILVIILFIIFIILIKQLKLSLNLSLLILFFASFRLMGRFTPRPHLMTYVFLLLVLFLIIRVRYLKYDNKTLYLLPFIFIVWANIHVNAVIGLIVFALYIAAELIEKKKLKDSDLSLFQRLKEQKVLLWIFLACFICLFLNPFFADTYIFEYSLSKLILLTHINEWKSPFDASNTSSLYNKIYFIFLILGLINLIYGIRKKDYFFIFIYLFTVFYSLQAVRFTFDYIILNLILLCISISFFINSSRFKSIKDLLSSNGIVSVVLALFFVFVSYYTWNNSIYRYILQTSFRETGIGINEKFYPVDLAHFMSDNKIDKIGSNVFNSLNCGGFLIWNFDGIKNFIDSRNLSDKQYNEYKYIEDKKVGFEEKLSSYHIDYIVYSTPYLTQNAREMEQTLITFLINNPIKWKLIFWDDKSFLFVKNDPKFKDLIDRFEYKYINPYNLVFNYQAIRSAVGIDQPEVLKELQRKLAEEPSGKFINDIRKRLNIF